MPARKPRRGAIVSGPPSGDRSVVSPTMAPADQATPPVAATAALPATSGAAAAVPAKSGKQQGKAKSKPTVAAAAAKAKEAPSSKAATPPVPKCKPRKLASASSSQTPGAAPQPVVTPPKEPRRISGAQPAPRLQDFPGWNEVTVLRHDLLVPMRSAEENTFLEERCDIEDYTMQVRSSFLPGLLCSVFCRCSLGAAHNTKRGTIQAATALQSAFMYHGTYVPTWKFFPPSDGENRQRGVVLDANAGFASTRYRINSNTYDGAATEASFFEWAVARMKTRDGGCVVVMDLAEAAESSIFSDEDDDDEDDEEEVDLDAPVNGGAQRPRASRRVRIVRPAPSSDIEMISSDGPMVSVCVCSADRKTNGGIVLGVIDSRDGSAEVAAAPRGSEESTGSGLQIPRVDFTGIAITGVEDPKSECVHSSIYLQRRGWFPEDELPAEGEELTLDRFVYDVTIVVRDLEPEKTYRLLRFDDPSLVPTSNFKNAPWASAVDFQSQGRVCLLQNVDVVAADQVAIYRTVRVE